MYEKFKLLNTTFSKFIGKKNEDIYKGLFAFGYLLLSPEKSHTTSTEYYSGKGKIDNIFVPIDFNEEKIIIIHEYKYTKKLGEH